MPASRTTTPTWVRSSSSKEYLYLGCDRGDGGCLLYRYSTYPGTVATLVIVPGPAMPGPADSVLADMLDQLTKGANL